MNRRYFLGSLLLLAITAKAQDKPYPVQKTDAEWKRVLTPEEYYVTRQKGTERAFAGKYLNNREKGVYHCVCCGAELFRSDTKYDSNTGWPSFYKPSVSKNIEETKDSSYGMARMEVKCSQCGAHLGHVYTDGPPPTKLRYSINSASLSFVKK
ncbi:MAG: peptide-methionine (R)-S-oxide reductase MsrB [Siphonobacter sp.]